MADEIRVEVFLAKGATKRRVSITEPIHWSGDQRRHLKQVKDELSKAIDILIAQLERSGPITSD